MRARGIGAFVQWEKDHALQTCLTIGRRAPEELQTRARGVIYLSEGEYLRDPYFVHTSSLLLYTP